MSLNMRWPIVPLLLLVLVGFPGYPLLAMADDAVAADTAAAVDDSNVEPGNPEDNLALESARRSVRSAAEWLASGVNSWFGDRPFKEAGGKVSDGRFGLSFYKRQDESVELTVRFSANFRLPNLEKNTYIFTGRDNRREVITDKPESFSREQLLQAQTEADRSFFAGIGRAVGDSVDFRIGFHGALKPYVQGRYRKSWEPSTIDAIDFRETVFVTAADRIGSTSALSYQHVFSPTLVGRWLSAATITQADSHFEWNSSVGAYKSLGAQRLLSLEFLVSGKQGTGVAVTDYGLQGRWEQPVYKDWLLAEFVLGRFWPRPTASSERGQVWAMGTGLRMLF